MSITDKMIEYIIENDLVDTWIARALGMVRNTIKVMKRPAAVRRFREGEMVLVDEIGFCKLVEIDDYERNFLFSTSYGKPVTVVWDCLHHIHKL